VPRGEAPQPLRVYWVSSLPAHWVVRDTANQLWLVPAVAGGWHRRTAYRGYAALLRPAVGAAAAITTMTAGGA
jgi:hypothetical protein